MCLGYSILIGSCYLEGARAMADEIPILDIIRSDPIQHVRVLCIVTNTIFCSTHVGD